MNKSFINSDIDIVNLIKQNPDKKQFLYENNIKQILEIKDFMMSNEKMLFISGFMGTGKSSITDKVFSYLNEQTIVLDYTCFETTILDDILLAFFDEFKKLTSQGIIETPKTKSENFTQKISAYFQNISNPIVIRINSWHNILKDYKYDIIDFFSHISKFSNVKFVLIGRKFTFEDFADKFTYRKVTVLALEKSLFEKYLKQEQIKNIGPISDELYKYTKGYYFYTTLAIKIMKIQKLQLIDFIAGYTKSMQSFNDFILREALALVDPVSGHLFRFLTLMRHPVDIELVKALNLYDEDRVIYFLENLVLGKLENSIYLPECYKEIAQNSIPTNISVKIHKACAQLYETQLPLKPLERNMMISRTTMRNEIEYHNLFVPQKPKFLYKQATSTPKISEEKPTSHLPQGSMEVARKAIQQVSFIFEDGEYSALDNIAASIENFVNNAHHEELENLETEGLGIVDLINLAQKEELEFNYGKVVAICQKCLTLKNDDDFYTFLPTIYAKLTNAYEKLSQWFEALKYLELSLEFYESTGDSIKIANVKFDMATIFYQTFKHDRAKALLLEVIDTVEASGNLKIKAYLQLADIEKNPDNDVITDSYYLNALELVESDTEKEVLAELYFKLGVISDEKGEVQRAVDFYKKCISVDGNFRNNSYLANALSNISSICDENGRPELAIKYCSESLKIDETTKNLNGIYQSSLKLGSLFRKKDFEKSVHYYKKAVDAAVELNEPFYIASSNLALGDYYFNKKYIDQALDCYLKSLEIAQKYFKKDNIAKVELRINDIKLKLGEVEFDKLVKGKINV